MTLDEAIAMMHEWADYECYNEEQIQASEAFNQIAVLLEELKAYRTLDKTNFSDGYNRAIDDFVHKVKEHQYVLSDVINSKDYGMFTIGIEQIAEQLKAGEAE